MSHANMMQFDSPEAQAEFYADLKRRRLQHCPICRTAKKQAEFSPSQWGKSGTYCIDCKRAANQARYAKMGRFESPIKYRERVYGITDEDYRALWSAQGGQCACCGTDLHGLNPKHIHVDHDHKTGMNRGILCRDCNIGLGCFLDEPARLRKAFRYLKQRIRLANIPKV